MKKILSAAALGVFGLLGAGTAQADVITSATVWTDQPSAGTNLMPVIAPSPPILTGPIAFGAGAEISFNLQSSTLAGGNGNVTAFLDSAVALGSTPWAVAA